MPKKTKKKKILAQLHRKLASLPSSPNIVKSQNNENLPAKPSLDNTNFVFKKQPVIKQKNATILTDHSYVKGDLIKITIFTTLALILQGVLYFLLNRG